MPTDEHAAFVAAANAETRVPTPDVPALTYETLPTYVSTLRGTIMGLAARIARSARARLDEAVALAAEHGNLRGSAIPEDWPTLEDLGITLDEAGEGLA